MSIYRRKNREQRGIANQDVKQRVSRKLLADWIQRGIVLAPVRPKAKLPDSPVRLPEDGAQRLLTFDRD